MPRLGELLVAAGELTADEVEQALRAQVMWGGRIGTNLVELGYIDLDKLANTLGRQHRLPAALARHFEKGEPPLQAKLSADVAEKFSCIPLLHAGPGKSQVIVAALAPLPAKAVAIIADELGVAPGAIIQSVAGELRVRYYLERVYQIPRNQRYLRAKGKSVPAFPHFDINALTFEDSQVDAPAFVVPTVDEAVQAVDATSDESQATDLAIEEARGELRIRFETKAAKALAEPETSQAPTLQLPQLPAEEIQDLEAVALLEEHDDEVAIPEALESDITSARERRRYVQTLDATPKTAAEEAAAEEAAADIEHSLGRIAIKRVTVTAIAEADAEPRPGKGLTLGEATRAIRRSTDRDRVADLVSETLFRFMLSCDAAQMLVIRGATAISWKGFSRAGAPLPDIAVQLDQPGLIPRAIERCETARLPHSELAPIDQLILVSLGATSGDLVIVPVSISNQVMCVIALATQHGAQTGTAESVAAAAGAAFARLMRNASR
jgi:hypothetical protein